MRRLFDKGRKLEIDETGRRRCLPCWDGHHFHKDKFTGKVIVDCEGNGCECLCTQHLANPVKRVKKLKNNPDQTVIDTGSDVLIFGVPVGPEHRDEG